MLKFLHNTDDDKAIAVTWVFSENSHAKNDDFWLWKHNIFKSLLYQGH